MEAWFLLSTDRLPCHRRWSLLKCSLILPLEVLPACLAFKLPGCFPDTPLGPLVRHKGVHLKESISFCPVSSRDKPPYLSATGNWWLQERQIKIKPTMCFAVHGLEKSLNSSELVQEAARGYLYPIWFYDILLCLHHSLGCI